MLKQGSGIFLMIFGGMMGNSECLIVPIIVILIGAWLALSNKGDN